jgi:hypothetical protein
VTALIAVTLAGCTSQPTILPSKDFDRPTDITFVCMGAFGDTPADGGDTDAGASTGLVVSGRPMRHCHPRNAPDPLPDTQHRTFGFLPNSANGTLSVINADAWKLVDLNPTLSSFNTYPLGRLPTQIVSSDDGCRLLTANRGSCDLSLVDPAALLQPTLAETTPGLPAEAPGGLAAIGTTVYPNYGPNHTRLPLLPQEVALIPTNTGALMGSEQLCTSAWTGQAIVTFPSCNLIALINLPGGEIVDGLYVRRSSDGKVEPEPLNGRAPECPVDCTAGGPSAVDGGTVASDAGTAEGGATDATPPSGDATATADADPDAGDAEAIEAGAADGGATEAGAADGGGPSPVTPVAGAVRPGPIAILPGGARAFVGLAEAPFIMAIDVRQDHLTEPPRADKGVITLHSGAVGTTRLRLSVDPYADKPTAPGFSGKFVGGAIDPTHSDRQYLYAIARDGTLRVVNVAVDPEPECETNVDPLTFPGGNADPALSRACLTVDENSARRRPSAIGPGIRLPAPPIDVAAADVASMPADTSETSVAGAHAWVMAANGVVYLVNIDPVPRFTKYVGPDGNVLTCDDPVTQQCQPISVPNTPRNRNVMSYSQTLGPAEGPARLDVEVSQPQIGPRIESIWTRGTADNAVSDPNIPPPVPYIETQVFFPDVTAPLPQSWAVTWEGAFLSAPRASGQIVVTSPTFSIQDPGLDYCRLGLRERDLVTLTGCTTDAQCGMNNACRFGAEGTVGAGGVPINGLCVRKELSKEEYTQKCDRLLSTVRRYEVTSASHGVLGLRPHMDELVRPDIDPCVVLPPTGPAGDGGADAGGDAGADAGADGGPIRDEKCVNESDPSTDGFTCVARRNPVTGIDQNRCLMRCEQVNQAGGCRAGRICVSFSGRANCDDKECFCADGPDLAKDEHQDPCFGELLSYQVNVGGGFLVSGSQTGIAATREATPGTGVCRDIPGLDPRVVSRISMDAPRCTNVPDNLLDSRCNPNAPERCPSAAALLVTDPNNQEREREARNAAVGEASRNATGLLNIAKTTVGVPNPCLFIGGPNEIDPLTPPPLPSHVHALYRNNELQFMMTNLDQPIGGAYQIRFDVHGGFQPQTVFIPPTVEVGMPARMVLGPFDAQVPSATNPNAADVPYLFVVDQRRLGRTQGGGPTRGQLLRIQPRGRAITIPAVGSQPWFEDFSKSGELFPIQ